MGKEPNIAKRAETETETVGTVGSNPPVHAPDRTSNRFSGLLAAQQAAGNRATNALVQAKLSVGPAGDRSEREADRVADDVVKTLRRPAEDDPADTKVAAKPAHAVARKIQARTGTFGFHDAPMAGDHVPRIQPRATAMIQREPMVKDLRQATDADAAAALHEVDAADWSQDDIAQWLDAFHQLFGTDGPDEFERFGDALRSLAEAGAERTNAAEKQKLAAASAEIETKRADLRSLWHDLRAEETAIGGNKVGCDHVVNELIAVYRSTEVIDQGPTQLCGPDSFLRTIARSDFDTYARFVITLLKTNTATLGGLTVTVPKWVRENFEHISEVRTTDWALNTTLRSQKNKLFTGDPTSMLAGFTTVGELAKWYRQIGVPEASVLHKSHLVKGVSPAEVDEMNEKLKGKWSVIALINPATQESMRAKSGDTAPVKYAGPTAEKHFVMLTGPITLSDSRYTCTMETYGKKSSFWFDANELGKSILGFVAADLNTLAANSSSDI